MDYDNAYDYEDELERRRESFFDLEESGRTERLEYAGSCGYWD